MGIDLLPALLSNDTHGAEIADSVGDDCFRKGGQSKISREAVDAIRAVANILNIAWVEESLAQPARIICPRSTRCPRQVHCNGAPAKCARDITDIRREILKIARL